MESLYEKITFRNKGVYSACEQDKLKNSHVCIVGVGCVGGLVATCLARLGLGKITLVDGDKYELSNINRQPMAFRSTVNRDKVRVAQEIIYDINPAVVVVPIKEYFRLENSDIILRDVNMTIQCIDDIISRIILHRQCQKRKIPSITMSGQPKYRSIVSTFLPGWINYEEFFGIRAVAEVKDEELESTGRELLKELSLERALGAVERGADQEWAENYKKGRVGWAVTTERTYIAGMLQVHESVRVLLGKEPLAKAPKAIVVDISDVPNIVRVGDPQNEEKWAIDGHWNHRYF